MIAYLSKVKKLISKFVELSIKKLPRSKNLNADALANLESSINLEFKRSIPIEVLAHPSILKLEELYSIETIEQTRINPIQDYIQNGNLPANRHEACKLSTRFWTANYISNHILDLF